MARLESMMEPMKSLLAGLPCPSFVGQPWAAGRPLAGRRISIISTAGVQRRGEPPFEGMTGDYRVIPGDVKAKDLVMTHISTNFDRTGFQQDWNLVFPLDRLHELAREGAIGSVADYHYSFMGAADPAKMEPAARNLASLLKGDGVDGALLVPV